MKYPMPTVLAVLLTAVACGGAYAPDASPPSETSTEPAPEPAPRNTLGLAYTGYSVEAGVETRIDRGCSVLDGPGFERGRPSEPRYVVRYQLSPELGVHFELAGAYDSAERDYDLDFIRSEATDEVIVALDADVSLRFVNEGSLDCFQEPGIDWPEIPPQ